MTVMTNRTCHIKYLTSNKKKKTRVEEKHDICSVLLVGVFVQDARDKVTVHEMTNMSR